MKRFLAALSISLLGCQAQPAPTPEEAAPQEAEPQEAEPTPAAPELAPLPSGHVRLTSEGVRGSGGEALSPAAIESAWQERAVHVHYEVGTSYGELLSEVLGPAIEAKSTSLVFHSPEGARETTRIDLVYVPPGVNVTFASLFLGPAGRKLNGKSVGDNEALWEALRTTRAGWRGSGELAIQLRIARSNEGLSLQDLQEIAYLVAESGCRPSFVAGDCAYAIEGKRFERAMAAKSLDERLRLLRAHIKAYPKPPRTSTSYSPFAWEWEGEIYVGNEWTEWTHVRSGVTTKPK